MTSYYHSMSGLDHHHYHHIRSSMNYNMMSGQHEQDNNNSEKTILATLLHQAERLKRKHLSKVEKSICQGFLPTPQDGPNWQEFMYDLQKCPALAFLPMAPSEYPPLFHVILVPHCPLEVVQLLLQLNPDSVKERCFNHGWNILQWIVWFATNTTTTTTTTSSTCNNKSNNNNHRIVSPDILKELLCRYPEAVTQYDDICQCTPLESFLYKDPDSAQFRTILETLPETTAILLLYHYMGELVLTPQVLDMALQNAEQLERHGICVYEMKVTYSESCLVAPVEQEQEETMQTTSLLSEMIKRLGKRNLVLFHRYLQGLVRGRAAHLREDYIEQDFGHTLSLQTCVYYALARIDLGSLLLLRGDDDYYCCSYACDDDDEDEDQDHDAEDDEDGDDHAWGDENLTTGDSPSFDPPYGGFGIETEQESEDDDEEEDGEDLVINARSFVRRVTRAFDDALNDPKYKTDAQSMGVQGAEDALLALRMGYQWDRLKVCFDWENLLHSQINGLPPFLLAASAVEKQQYNTVMGSTYTKDEYEADDSLNGLNNTFELLRMDSTVIQCATGRRPPQIPQSKQAEVSGVCKNNRKRKVEDYDYLAESYERCNGKKR